MLIITWPWYTPHPAPSASERLSDTEGKPTQMYLRNYKTYEWQKSRTKHEYQKIPDPDFSNRFSNRNFKLF